MALTPSGKLIAVEPHEKVAGAVMRSYRVPQGCIVLTEWENDLHQVIYQTPLDTLERALSRNDELFEHYGEGLRWREVLDNGFGKTYFRSDDKLYATWSYVMDFTTFTTIAFRDARHTP